MIEHSEQINELAAALAKAQSEIKGAVRESNNPFFNSKYADLASVWEACRTALTNQGIAVLQGPSAEGSVLSVTTELVHSSGQWARSRLSTTLKDMTPQTVGSATTYLRRYGLSAMVGVAPLDDDDGNAAQGNTGGPQSRAARREAAREQSARDAAENGPYAERERQKAEAKAETAGEAQINGWAKLQQRMTTWAPEVAAVIPPDEATYLMPEQEAEDNRDFYLKAIQEIADRLKLKPEARQALRAKFAGSPSAPLKTANVYLLRAMWKHLTALEEDQR